MQKAAFSLQYFVTQFIEYMMYWSRLANNPWHRRLKAGAET
tara:strand:- start:69 stop:191 length:123 start_codon:yes stop_codon:yes gene_type:complete